MNIKFAVAALLVVSTTSSALAATTATQKFTVTVPSAISIVAPTNVSLIHDESENNQLFPKQPWVVRGNTLAGVTVSFSTNSAFQHTTNAAAKRNASLALAVNTSVGPAVWTVTQATDTTDYATNDGVATVQATSNGVGRATLDVSVSFVTAEFGSFPAGEYETTVTGTVAAN
jgi:hypothetical protein